MVGIYRELEKRSVGAGEGFQDQGIVGHFLRYRGSKSEVETSVCSGGKRSGGGASLNVVAPGTHSSSTEFQDERIVCEFNSHLSSRMAHCRGLVYG